MRPDIPSALGVMVRYRGADVARPGGLTVASLGSKSPEYHAGVLCKRSEEHFDCLSAMSAEAVRRITSQWFIGWMLVRKIIEITEC